MYYTFRMTNKRTYMSDFLGGVDPTGTHTFQYGMHDAAAAGGGPSAARRAVGTAGGMLGGAAVLPAVTGGIIGGVKGLTMGRGGLKQRLLSAGKGALSGAKDPYSRLYRGAKAQQALKAYGSGGGQISKSHAKNLDKFVRNVTPVELPGNVVNPKAIKEQLTKLNPEQMSEVRRHMGGDIAAGAGALGLSGAVSGLSAHQQYDKGVATQEVANKQLEKARQHPAMPPKTAAFQLGYQDALSALIN